MIKLLQDSPGIARKFALRYNRRGYALGVPCISGRTVPCSGLLAGAGDRFRYTTFPRGSGCFPVRPFVAFPLRSGCRCCAVPASRDESAYERRRRRSFLLQTTTFAELGLSAKVQAAIQAAGYTEPTPIQAQAIPVAVTGRDVLGIAQTGTGKTAGFVLPMLARLESRPRTGAHAALADPGPDARARRPGGAELREVRHQPQAHRGAADRRRLVRRPAAQARPRRRRADRHAGPPARPLRARQDPADRRRDPGDRRSRPHARHGLHSRHRADLQAAAAAPADAVLLGHHAAGDHSAWSIPSSRTRCASRSPGPPPPPRPSRSCSATAPPPRTGRSARSCAS